MGTNWSTGSSSRTWGRTSLVWRWWSTGTGCPGRLWILLLWRYSRPTWMRSFAACCRWPCFGKWIVLGDPQRSLPTPTILWFCDSVKLPPFPLELYWHNYASLRAQTVRTLAEGVSPSVILLHPCKICCKLANPLLLGKLHLKVLPRAEWFQMGYAFLAL